MQGLFFCLSSQLTAKSFKEPICEKRKHQPYFERSTDTGTGERPAEESAENRQKTGRRTGRKPAKEPAKDRQKDQDQCKGFAKMREITGKTRFGGLIGSPVEHSKSPAMHNYAFPHLGIDWVYLAFDVSEGRVGEAVKALRELNAFGFNVTMPHKMAVMEYLDEIDEAADLIGAVNTVVNRDGCLTGYNTDGYGFSRSVREKGFELEGSEITIIGAGGAGRSAIVQAALDGVKKLHILNRRTRSYLPALTLAQRISEKTSCQADLTDLDDADSVRDKIEASSLLVNATPLGMLKGAGRSPVKDLSLLRPDLFVMDFIYDPPVTALLEDARKAGCSILNGKDMLLWQGERAFRLWTGQDMPVEEVRSRFF
jgi:shikimate dehydrogenase